MHIRMPCQKFRTLPFVINHRNFTRNSHTYSQDGDFRLVYSSLASSLSITTHIIQKCRYNYKDVTVKYGQPSFVNIQCVLRK